MLRKYTSGLEIVRRKKKTHNVATSARFPKKILCVDHRRRHCDKSVTDFILTFPSHLNLLLKWMLQVLHVAAAASLPCVWISLSTLLLSVAPGEKTRNKQTATVVSPMTADQPAGLLRFVRRIYMFFFSFQHDKQRNASKWERRVGGRCRNQQTAASVYKCSSVFCILQVNGCSWTGARNGREKKIIILKPFECLSAQKVFCWAKPLFEVKHLDVALCENPYKVNKPLKAFEVPVLFSQSVPCCLPISPT